MSEPRSSAATEQATGRYEFPYNRTFQAIAAATSVYAEGVGVNVSVKAFQEAFNSFPDARPLSEPQPSAGSEPVAWREETMGAGKGWYYDEKPWSKDAQPLYAAPPQTSLTQQIEAEARRYAGMYPQSSDGRNTFVIFADWVASQGGGK